MAKINRFISISKNSLSGNYFVFFLMIYKNKNVFSASTNDATRTGWFSNPDHNLESSISPRPMKRLSSNLKNSKKTMKHEQSVESPPESPLQILRKK